MRWALAVLLFVESVVALGAGVDAIAESGTRVVLETELGEIEIAVYESLAPQSAGSFLEYVDAGVYDGAEFYRVVSPENDRGKPLISVVQGGISDGKRALAPVAHETTAVTGILHTNGTVSLARSDPGTASGAAFFICIGEQPSLDFGGLRNSDRLGFAAFGKVVDGMDVVRQIHSREANGPAESPYLKGQMLTEPVEITRARRVPAQ